MTSPDEIERPDLNPAASKVMNPYWAREHLPKVCLYALAQEARISALEAKLEEAEDRNSKRLNLIKSLKVEIWHLWQQAGGVRKEIENGSVESRHPVIRVYHQALQALKEPTHD
jgi:hypothetical protein